MALDNFANLKAAVIRFSHRTDLSNVLDDVVKLAENRIDNRLRVSINNLRATDSTSTSDRFLSLPTRFVEMRRFSLIKNNYYNDLVYTSPESMNIYSVAGVPKYFTITNQVEFDRVAAEAYTVEFSYFAKLNPLSTSNTTNNVLTDFPQVYLQACLAELHLNYTQDDSRAQTHLSQFDYMVNEANAEDLRGRYGPAPKMKVESATP